ncbi:epoxide hydrolase N-terminal domain-containing protein [Mesorhizobium sp. B3-1-7]|uniref:epoxide hydrolase N-terminal domain-containing protein n=1 Tax=Mesorhizobium sp. B3-1-7 TaxID=2589894 RepID=UPI001FEF04CA|nr:epoxide hydrolase N-terminal domain-containing protein [Mesorhizobium sp. B3-1-7]
MDIHPFTIRIAQAEIDDLMRRIASWREPDQLEGIGWAQGTEREELRRLLEHWSSGFDWRRQEDAWNKLPHYQTEIGGQTIHFIHVRAQFQPPKRSFSLMAGRAAFANSSGFCRSCPIRLPMAGESRTHSTS